MISPREMAEPASATPAQPPGNAEVTPHTTSRYKNRQWRSRMPPRLYKRLCAARQQTAADQASGQGEEAQSPPAPGPRQCETCAVLRHAEVRRNRWHLPYGPYPTVGGEPRLVAVGTVGTIGGLTLTPSVTSVTYPLVTESHAFCTRCMDTVTFRVRTDLFPY